MVLLNDAVTGAQTESGALPDGLGGVKGFEDALRLPQARPGIRKFERELSAVHAQSDVQRAAVDFFESVDGVRNELQKNQELYKGLPILQYLSMGMAGAQGAATTNSNAQNTDKGQSASSSGPPTSASEALVKGFGGLFGGKKKKKEDAAADSSTSSTSASNPPPPAPMPGSLIEMTIEASEFSDAKLDPSLFTVPAGYTRLPNDPNNLLGTRQPPKQ